MNLTRAQRVALKKVFDLYCASQWRDWNEPPMSYRKFRQLARPGPGCVMIPWCGMWLGIEPDGYTHS